MDELQKAFEEFKKLPDWYLYPLPEILYKHFQLKKPKPASTMEILTYQPPLAEYAPTETRGPAEGGIREVPQAPPVELDLKVIEDSTEKTSSSYPQDSQQSSADSKEASETKSQPSEGPSSPHVSHGALDTTSSELHLGAL